MATIQELIDKGEVVLGKTKVIETPISGSGQWAIPVFSGRGYYRGINSKYNTVAFLGRSAQRVGKCVYYTL